MAASILTQAKIVGWRRTIEKMQREMQDSVLPGATHEHEVAREALRLARMGLEQDTLLSRLLGRLLNDVPLDIEDTNRAARVAQCAVTLPLSEGVRLALYNIGGNGRIDRASLAHFTDHDLIRMAASRL